MLLMVVDMMMKCKQQHDGRCGHSMGASMSMRVTDDVTLMRASDKLLIMSVDGDAGAELAVTCYGDEHGDTQWEVTM